MAALDQDISTGLKALPCSTSPRARRLTYKQRKSLIAKINTTSQEEQATAKQKLTKQKARLHLANKTEVLTRAAQLDENQTLVDLINRRVKLNKKSRPILIESLARMPEKFLQQLKPGALIAAAGSCGLRPVDLLAEYLDSFEAKPAELKELIKQLQIDASHIMLRHQFSAQYEPDYGQKAQITITADPLSACFNKQPNQTELIEILLAAGADPLYSAASQIAKNCSGKYRKHNGVIHNHLAHTVSPHSPAEEVITSHIHRKFKSLVAKTPAKFSPEEEAWIEQAYYYLRTHQVEILEQERVIIDKVMHSQNASFLALIRALGLR